MPYSTLKDLPESVRKVLPEHAQEIYFAAFNKTWQRNEGSEDGIVLSELEEKAHKIAWSAVKRIYEKVNGSWILKRPVED